LEVGCGSGGGGCDGDGDGDGFITVEPQKEDKAQKQRVLLQWFRQGKTVSIGTEPQEVYKLPFRERRRWYD